MVEGLVNDMGEISLKQISLDEIIKNLDEDKEVYIMFDGGQLKPFSKDSTTGMKIYDFLKANFYVMEKLNV